MKGHGNHQKFKRATRQLPRIQMCSGICCKPLSHGQDRGTHQLRSTELKILSLPQLSYWIFFKEVRMMSEKKAMNITLRHLMLCNLLLLSINLGLNSITFIALLHIYTSKRVHKPVWFVDLSVLHLVQALKSVRLICISRLVQV